MSTRKENRKIFRVKYDGEESFPIIEIVAWFTVGETRTYYSKVYDKISEIRDTIDADAASQDEDIVLMTRLAGIQGLIDEGVVHIYTEDDESSDAVKTWELPSTTEALLDVDTRIWAFLMKIIVEPMEATQNPSFTKS